MNNPLPTYTYQGISLPPEYAPFIEQNLADALATIDGAMKHERWIMSACVDLRLPDYRGFLRPPCTNHLALKFVKRMQHYARWKHTDLHDGIRQLHRPVVDAIWQKAYASSGVPFYRVMLLLNSEAYNSQTTGFDPAETLQYRAKLAWANLMNIPKEHWGHYVRFPADGMMHVDTTADGLCQLFAKASALCTAPTSFNDQGFVLFGSTRQVRRHRMAI